MLSLNVYTNHHTGYYSSLSLVNKISLTNHCSSFHGFTHIPRYHNQTIDSQCLEAQSISRFRVEFCDHLSTASSRNKSLTRQSRRHKNSELNGRSSMNKHSNRQSRICDTIKVGTSQIDPESSVIIQSTPTTIVNIEGRCNQGIHTRSQ